MGLLGTYKSYCQELNDDFLRKNLWGYWKVRQESYTDGYPISHAESLSCNNEGFFFSTDSIVVAKGKCMLGETCYEPKYMYAKEGKTPE